MAKFGNRSTAYCTKCGQSARVTIETVEPDVSYSDRGTNYAPRTQRITIECGCVQPHFTEWSIDNRTKETPVAKQFDTTEVKNTTLNTIVSKIKKLELALFDKAQAVAAAEAEHNKRIADASIALDRVLMEALQNDVDVEDYDNFLPEFADNLQDRVASLVELVELANVEASV